MGPLACFGRHHSWCLLHLLHVRVRRPFAASLVALLSLTICRCITARRRRRNNLPPWRGTGWAGGRTPAGHAPAQYTGGAQPYYNNQQPQTNPAPPYSAANQGYYGNQGNQGYFGGGQQNGVELQQPNSTYQPQAGGDPVYSPPSGPPPGKQHDGIIR